MDYYFKLGRAGDLANRKERLLYRAFEMLPGVLAWLTLGFVIIFSFLAPAAAAIFIIIFNIYWLIKTVYLSFHLRIGFKQVRENMQVAWLDEVKKLTIAESSVPGITSWQDIYHLILLPRYKEGWDVIESTLDSLAKANYPKDRLIVVLAQEERAGKEDNALMAHKVCERFDSIFFKLIVTEHPENLPGELAGKGSNLYWTGKKIVREVIDAMQIPYEHVLVSAFDIDTIASPEYFSRLTHVYLTTKDPLHASYQPVPFYINNIWESPAISRVSAFSTTFWQTIKQEQDESMITYSSHSMPLRALADVDFWQPNVISEDSRIFWQALLHYNGNYRVEPLYYPVSMDANLAHSYVQTMINVYKQHRRWGYGAENIAYFLFGFYKNKQVPLRKKLMYAFVMIEGVWSWSTNPIMLFLLSWLPLFIGGSAFNTTVLAFNLPQMTRFITTFAMVGLATSVIFALSVLPPRPVRYGKFRHIMMAFQWLIFPIRSIFFGAIPALDAQTRLMLGKYMGFWVTPKVRETTILEKPQPELSKV